MAPEKLDEILDGPALTVDGLVLELDGGSASYFSHDKEGSPSHAAKSAAKADFHMHQALHVAHEACDAEARINAAESCCVDETGVVHGMSVPVSPEEKTASALRSKLFREKRRTRNRCDSGGKLSVDISGQVHSADDFEAEDAFQRQCSIDSDGVVHTQDTSPSLSPQAKCVSPHNLKRFHRKRLSRSRAETEEDLLSEAIISVDIDGIIRDRRQLDLTPLIMPAVVSAH
jgi:hypothetical protein